MGKRYYCDYCDKTMVATPTIIRTHLKGTVHQKLVSEHYQQYKDAATILKEESYKKPCLRFLKGECNFGGICRFSHYTQEQIEALREYVVYNEQIKVEPQQPSFSDLYQRLQSEKTTKSTSETTIYDNNGVTHTFPWIYNESFNIYKELPPSLRRFRAEDFTDVSFTEWG
ncbi:PREDICTED: zinc finger matrin-type protein 5 [Papilio polytes]|uniref:zinc finger matrin-type protein 5 n=1 Tax=Papilio polytes TaxID=76194 RepID=UPI0006767E0F|nr:PREDICTED: zinc finger matrin-type protein 5 [Papilio polytes]XP_013145511.1 PREDICTED: zinc finger matrin-type protein 5 [Papilio polytes]